MNRFGAAHFVCLIFLSVISSGQTGTPVTLRMSWALGDHHYGPNFVSLQTKCANPASNCLCVMNFKVISSSPNSGAFADYIRSFGKNEVPVTFKVLHGADHKFLGAALTSVGDWSSEKFATNDRLLGVQIKFEPGKGRSSVPLNSPGDCFPAD
jgi:hypothetical protein